MRDVVRKEKSHIYGSAKAADDRDGRYQPAPGVNSLSTSADANLEKNDTSQKQGKCFTWTYPFSFSSYNWKFAVKDVRIKDGI